MSILIDGVEMPKEGDWISLNISPDGKCFIQSWCGKDFNFAEKLTAVPVPPHGRCIDADALKVSLAFAEKTAEWAVPALRAVMMVIDEMPTIIPADAEEAVK